MYNKIFCIGLNKTGTKSLHLAFKILKYESIHYKGKEGNIKQIIKRNYNSDERLLKGIENYDVYLDWNNADTNFLFKTLDKQYPKSKFILNTRDLDGWLKSREKHVRSTPNLKDKQLHNPYNTWYNINKEAWIEVYEKHHKEVLEYFKNREQDLLVFNLFEGDSWSKLCGFLDKSIPNEPFPYSNKSPNFIKKLYKKLKKSIKSI